VKSAVRPSTRNTDKQRCNCSSRNNLLRSAIQASLPPSRAGTTPNKTDYSRDLRPTEWESSGPNELWVRSGHCGAATRCPHAGCHGSVLLSRSDLRELDQYAEEYGELIARFLKIIFLSTLSSLKEIAAREAIGLRMTRRYLQAFRGMQASPSSWKSVGRRLIAALWTDGRVFNGENLRLITPHLDRALRLQMRLNAAQLQADIISGALDHLTLGVILIDRAGMPIWHNRRAHEITASTGGLRIARNGLAGASPADTQVLRELIMAAVCEGAQGLLALERGVESRPLLLIAMPLKPVGAPDLKPVAVRSPAVSSSSTIRTRRPL